MMTEPEGATADPSIVRDESCSGTSTVDGLTIRWAAVSDVGLVRETNEDGAVISDGIYVLADGMGGHECGELASEAAMVALAQTERSDVRATQASVEEQLVAAQRAIAEVDSNAERSAGTTVSGIVLVDDIDSVADEDADRETSAGKSWLILNIGDSRTYRLSDGDFAQITVDHSQVQELVDAGFLTPEQARVDHRRNVITRALGAGMEPDADFYAIPVRPGDRILMCSDGLTGEVTDEKIGELLAGGDDLSEIGADLVAAALEGGGRDNVTIVIVEVVSGEAEQPQPITGDDSVTGSDPADSDGNN